MCGISYRAILGGSYRALSPLIERGVLGVGGADFALMMFRARPLLGFLALFATVLPDDLDQQQLAVLISSRSMTTA